MERPVWTCCFAFIWFGLAGGAVWTHMTLLAVMPEIDDLPSSLAAGLEDLFRLGHLEADALEVRDACVDAVRACGHNASSSCRRHSFGGPGGPANDTTLERQRISAALGSSLAHVGRVASDKYLGTDRLQDTAAAIRGMKAEVRALDPAGRCSQQLPRYCKIRKDANTVLDEMEDVKSEIQTFHDIDEVKEFKDMSKWYHALHALPYAILLALAAFAMLWCLGATCPCYDPGRQGYCSLLAYVLLWTLSLAATTALVCAGGLANQILNRVTLRQFKGGPSAGELLAHLETEFPSFYDAVFEDLVNGIFMLFCAVLVLWMVCIAIFVYGCCMCLLQPYTADDSDNFEHPVSNEKSNNSMPSLAS